MEKNYCGYCPPPPKKSKLSERNHNIRTIQLYYVLKIIFGLLIFICFLFYAILLIFNIQCDFYHQISYNCDSILSYLGQILSIWSQELVLSQLVFFCFFNLFSTYCSCLVLMGFSGLRQLWLSDEGSHSLLFTVKVIL